MQFQCWLGLQSSPHSPTLLLRDWPLRSTPPAHLLLLSDFAFTTKLIPPPPPPPLWHRFLSGPSVAFSFTQAGNTMSLSSFFPIRVLWLRMIKSESEWIITLSDDTRERFSAKSLPSKGETLFFKAIPVCGSWISSGRRIARWLLVILCESELSRLQT